MNIRSLNFRLVVGVVAVGLLISSGYRDSQLWLLVNLTDLVALNGLPVAITLLTFLGIFLKSRLDKCVVDADGVIVELAVSNVNSSDKRQPSSSDQTQLTPNKNKILFVDDDRVSRSVMTSLLIATGFEVDDVESGAHALVRLQSEDYGVVVIDCNMPGMNGLELAGLIRNSAIGSPKLPILIALTGGLLAQEREQADVVFDEVILKPIRAKELSSILTSLLAGLQTDARPK